MANGANKNGKNLNLVDKRNRPITFRRGNYRIIPDKIRHQLINLVVEKKFNVVAATKKLGIKYTTGKHIVKRYLNGETYHNRRDVMDFGSE